LPYAAPVEVATDYDRTWCTIADVFERYEVVRQLPYHCIPATIEAGLRYLCPAMYSSSFT
jgi:hypothetical protein